MRKSFQRMVERSEAEGTSSEELSPWWASTEIVMSSSSLENLDRRAWGRLVGGNTPASEERMKFKIKSVLDAISNRPLLVCIFTKKLLGYKNKEIASALGYTSARITQLLSEISELAKENE